MEPEKSQVYVLNRNRKHLSLFCSSVSYGHQTSIIWHSKVSHFFHLHSFRFYSHPLFPEDRMYSQKVGKQTQVRCFTYTVVPRMTGTLWRRLAHLADSFLEMNFFPPAAFTLNLAFLTDAGQSHLSAKIWAASSDPVLIWSATRKQAHFGKLLQSRPQLAYHS